MASRCPDLKTKKWKKYNGDSSEGIRLPLVPLWGWKNEVFVPKWGFQNTVFGLFGLVLSNRNAWLFPGTLCKGPKFDLHLCNSCQNILVLISGKTASKWLFARTPLRSTQICSAPRWLLAKTPLSGGSTYHLSWHLSGHCWERVIFWC